MDSGRQELSKKILLPVSILFFFLSCHVYFPSIDRKALFLFCNVILLFVTTRSIVEVDETAKTDASPNYSKTEVVEIEPCLVEENAAATTATECFTNRTEPEKAVQLEKPETDDAGSRSPRDDPADDGEEDESMRFKIIDEDQQRDELQEKIEAFIEKVKRQRRMEVLQLATMRRSFS